MPEMLAVQKPTGWPANSGIPFPADYAHMMRNPPWALFFVLPLGLFDFLTSRTIYFMVCLVIVGFSTKWLWQTLGGSKKFLWIALFIAFTFPSTTRSLDAGQICVLLLLGLALFFYCVRREQWFWAGAAASVLLIKPHALFLFGVALVLWVLHNRCWRFILGALTGLLTATAVTWLFVPNIFEHYLFSIQDYPFQSWTTFTPGTLLRETFGLEKTWFDYIYSVFGTGWLLWYWRRHRHDWRWEETLPMLVLASAATTVFGWDADYIIVLPAILSIALRIETLSSLSQAQRRKVFILTGCYVAIVVLYYFPAPHDRFHILGIAAYRWGECLFATSLWILYAMMHHFLGRKDPAGILPRA
ncbi:MAG: DUF2029 domain-containing protein [Deltaproteobacteria bacterium]|nr:DUF2029 domain-containing protein [Deltaproteobacteria bacterium]